MENPRRAKQLATGAFITPGSEGEEVFIRTYAENMRVLITLRIAVRYREQHNYIEVVLNLIRKILVDTIHSNFNPITGKPENENKKPESQLKILNTKPYRTTTGNE